VGLTEVLTERVMARDGNDDTVSEGEADSETVVRMDAEYDGDGVPDIDLAADAECVKMTLEVGERVIRVDAVGEKDFV